MFFSPDFREVIINPPFDIHSYYKPPSSSGYFSRTIPKIPMIFLRTSYEIGILYKDFNPRDDPVKSQVIPSGKVT